MIPVRIPNNRRSTNKVTMDSHNSDVLSREIKAAIFITIAAFVLAVAGNLMF